MKKSKQPDFDEGQCLFSASFTADDASMYEDISKGAITSFKKLFDGYRWVISQDGTIRNYRAENLRKVVFHLDLTEEYSRRSFNMFRECHQGPGIHRDKQKNFLVDIIYFDEEPSNDKTQQTDTLVFSNGNLCLRKFHTAWEDSQSAERELLRDIVEIESSL